MVDGVLQLGGADPVPLGILGVLALVALGIVTYGVARLQTYVRLQSMGTTDAHSVGSGLVKVEGEAGPGPRTLEAPFSGSECLAYEIEVKRYRQTKQGSNWRRDARGRRSVPFHVRDGTGTVGVEPTEGSLSVYPDYRIVVDRDERAPERVQAFFDGDDDLDHDSPAFDVSRVSIEGDRKRFTERRIDPGQTASVAGHADPTTAVDGESPTVVDGNGDGRLGSLFGDPFVVADAGENEAEQRHLIAGTAALLFGAASLAVPLFIFVNFVLG